MSNMAAGAPRTVDNLVRHELIGLQVAVVAATDDGKTDITGRVIDETRNTLVIDTGNGEKTVPKADAIFRFTLEDAQVRMEGSLIVGRPEERILKKFPQKWEYTD